MKANFEIHIISKQIDIKPDTNIVQSKYRFKVLTIYEYYSYFSSDIVPNSHTLTLKKHREK